PPRPLHGFYFDVESLGSGLRDVPNDDAHRRRVVTQLVPSGGTMTMAWTAEREGNWLFHCHIMSHVSPERRLAGGEGAHSHHDASTGMAGMGVRGSVVRAEGLAPPERPTPNPKPQPTPPLQPAAGRGGPPATRTR